MTPKSGRLGNSRRCVPGTFTPVDPINDGFKEKRRPVALQALIENAQAGFGQIGMVESANTRTWNFLIDIIAQSGEYPKTATTLDNFIVTGERRYWLHIAIDRYTGQVIDKDLEIVNE